MSAVPSSRSPQRGQEAHEARDMAESFGADADRYDRARPGYPAQLVEQVVAGSPGPEFLDVGCGTGIAGRLFHAAGCQVLGVEVDARMADVARRRGLPVEVARFEDWDPAGRVFDAVVAGQAWHWIDPVGGAAKAAQVLRPGGRLAVFWNAFQPPADLAAAFAAVYGRVMPELPVLQAPTTGPEAYATLCARAADGMRAAGLFGEPEQWRFAWERLYSRDEWLDQLQTSAFQGKIPPARMSEILAGVGAAIDDAGGSFMVHYTTVTVTGVRGAAASTGTSRSSTACSSACAPSTRRDTEARSRSPRQSRSALPSRRSRHEWWIC